MTPVLYGTIRSIQGTRNCLTNPNSARERVRAKDAAEAKAKGVVVRVLTEMRNQTLRDETASACAMTLARHVNAAEAIQVAILIQDKTRRAAVIEQLTTAQRSHSRGTA